MIKRKLQISNGHYFDTDQLARILYSITNADPDDKVTFSYLEEDTGLPFRQIRNRVSIARAMGIFEESKIKLTPFGELISKHDPFVENKATLEFAHYLAAGNFRNLVWYEVFNTLLIDEQPKSYDGWLKYFRETLAKDYSEHSIKDHVGKEVRFIIDAYVKGTFVNLALLHLTSDEILYRRRYTSVNNMILAATIYDYGFKQDRKLFEVIDILKEKGSPGHVFFLDESTLRQSLEDIHEKGWARYEGTHNLDQVRLKDEFSAIEFMIAFYEDRDPAM